MKKLILLLSFGLLTLSGFAQNNHRIIIKLNPNLKANNEVVLERRIGITAIDAINNSNQFIAIRKLNSPKKSNKELFIITFPSNTNPENIIKAYRSTGLIEYAELDGKGSSGGVKGTKSIMNTPNDALFSRQWALKNDGSFALFPAVAGADVEMEDAWDMEDGSNDIVIAIMDSGIRLNHPEFEGRIWTNTGEIPNNNIDDDANGFIDDNNGWDFVNDDNDPTDDFGHGTNVAGIVGANGDNMVGYAGVDKHCKLMALKGLDDENIGFYSWWYDAINYAVDNGAHIINLSVGGNSVSATLQEAIEYALENNVVVVACMMNIDSNTNYYPAKYNGVIAVGATNPDDKRASPFFWSASSGSNYGDHISVVAPGNFIYGLSHTSDTDYDTYWGGTSQATPLVSGIAALLLAQDNTMTPAIIKSVLEHNAEDMVGDPTEDTPGFDVYYGHGRVNAKNSLVLDLSRKKHSDRSLFVYPNPSEGKIKIDAEYYPATVTVYNTLGQSVLIKEIYVTDNTIVITSPGIYLVSVKNGTMSATQKVVIR